jgi:hypothetical protein
MLVIIAVAVRICVRKRGSTNIDNEAGVKPDILPAQATAILPGNSSSVDVNAMYAEVRKPPRNQPATTFPTIVSDIYAAVIPISQRSVPSSTETQIRTCDITDSSPDRETNSVVYAELAVTARPEHVHRTHSANTATYASIDHRIIFNK